MIKHIHVDVCDSTQDLLKEQTTSAGETLLISTNKQSKGRGRGTNVWQDLPGSLCFSLTVRPHKIMSFTALEISLLIARFFEFEGCKLGLKWPNDLWDSRGMKCGGVLVQGSNQDFYAGIGLNLFSDHADFGGIYRESFTFDKKSWSYRISEFIIAHRYEDTDVLRKDWELRCAHMLAFVSITEGTEKWEGIFTGLGANGEAVLENAEGKKSIYNGTLRVI
ncbi:MAG: biotin--[acetyl-CoA-carboxylase] ligase [Bacteriovoracaceae bacterium]